MNLNECDKHYVFFVNSDPCCEYIIKELLKEKYKITLVVDKLQDYTNNYFDAWENFENVYDILLDDMNWEKNLENFLININYDQIISLWSINKDHNIENDLKLFQIIKKLNHGNFILINQLKKSTNRKHENLIEQYLSEVYVSFMLDRFKILRIGKFEKNNNFTKEKLLSYIELMMKDEYIINYPMFYKYRILNFLNPSESNINIFYDNQIIKKKDVKFYSTPEYFHHYHTFNYYKKVIIYGLIFKCLSHFIYRRVKKI